MHSQITSLDDLMMYSVSTIRNNLKVDKINNKTKLILLKWKIHYTPFLSNSHCSPISGTINSQGQDPYKPRSYPGWKGRVWVFYSHSPNDFCSEYFENSLIHTESGGYGLYEIEGDTNNHISHPKDLPTNRCDRWAYKDISIYPASYNCKIFLDDLPGIKALNLLGNTNPEPFHECVYENDH